MYYVQFGIFKKFENAHSFQQLAERYDLNSEIIYDGTFYRVVSKEYFKDKYSAIALREVARNRCKKFSCSCIKTSETQRMEDMGTVFDFNDLSCAIDEMKSNEKAWHELCKVLSEKGFVESKRDCGYTGIEIDYPVSIKEVLDITAETGALETQARIRELKPYKHPITGKEAHCAGILLNVIKNVETPMLMCQAEKDIVERALRIVLGDL